MKDIKNTVKDYILKEFLPGENPDQLTDSTPLVTGGILDSLSSLKLMDFLEEQFCIETEAHEVSEEHLDSLADIANFVESKLANSSV